MLNFAGSIPVGLHPVLLPLLPDFERLLLLVVGQLDARVDLVLVVGLFLLLLVVLQLSFLRILSSACSRATRSSAFALAIRRHNLTI